MGYFVLSKIYYNYLFRLVIFSFKINFFNLIYYCLPKKKVNKYYGIKITENYYVGCEDADGYIIGWINCLIILNVIVYFINGVKNYFIDLFHLKNEISLMNLLNLLKFVQYYYKTMLALNLLK